MPLAVDYYLSPNSPWTYLGHRRFHELEKEHLWPKVWQIACRLEEIPEVGDYATYEILDDSIVVVRRGPDAVAAYHNACPHRGTLLVEGKGSIREFLCPFHGWRFGLDGRNVEVVDAQDWGHCLKPGDTDLVPVQAGVWGGWVWINMDPDCQPLAEFLSPMAPMCELFEFEKLRPAWNKSVIVPANWKTVLGAFTALPVQIYTWVKLPDPAFQSLAAGAILVLLGIVLTMNAVAIYLRNRFRQDW